MRRSSRPLHLREHTVASPQDVQGRLAQAVGMNRPDDVRALLDQGADVNAFSPVQTPLNIAVSVDNLEMIDLLIDRGANVNAPGVLNGVPPIFFALRNHARLDTVQRLFQHGADPTSVDGDGESVVSVALSSSHRGALGLARTVLHAMSLVEATLTSEQWAPVIEQKVLHGQHKLLTLLADFGVPPLPAFGQERVRYALEELCPRSERQKVRAVMDRLHVVHERRALMSVMNEATRVPSSLTAPAPSSIALARRRL